MVIPISETVNDGTEWDKIFSRKCIYNTPKLTIILKGFGFIFLEGETKLNNH